MCAGEEVNALERQRADRRASKRRKQVTVQQARLQEDGTTSVMVYATRPYNRKVTYSRVSGMLRETHPELHSRFLAVAHLLAEALKAREGTSASAARPLVSGGVARQQAAEAHETAQPSTGQQRRTSRNLSTNAAQEDIVSRWRSRRLGETATGAELQRYLAQRGVQVHSRAKPALLARVAALLAQDYPDGVTLLKMPGQG